MAVPNAESPQPFDEDAVLRDLEHLRGQILEARARREKKAAEFDTFVKQSRAASHAERIAAVENLEAATRAQSAARTAERAGAVPLSAAASPFSPTSSVLFPDDVGPPASRRIVIPRSPATRHRFGRAAALLEKTSPQTLGVAGAGLLAVLVLIYSFSGSDPAPAAQPQPSQTASPPAAQAQTAALAAASAQPVAAKPDPRPIQIQLEAIRPVWMQVVVDGRREIGRTVPQGQRLSFGANNEINLRAGDAGAVRVYVAGADRGLLGRDGQVVNRRFTK